jgi:hypothetical protein
LAQQTRQQVARVRATPQVRQRRPTQIGRAENLVQLAVGQEPSIGGDLGPVEFQLEAAVEIDTQRCPFRLTHLVCHDRVDRVPNIATTY